MKLHFKSAITLLVIIFFPTGSIAQSLQHPTIYATAAERQQILDKISNNAWAQSMVNSLKSKVDSKIVTHNTNPAAIFSTVDFFPANDANSEAYASPYTSAHGKVLSTAAYSAMLYYITEDVKYASFSADILNYYFDNLSTRTLATTTISGNYFYDPRTTYAQFAVAYDFIYNYLKTPGITVYNKTTNTRVPYDHTRAQTVIKNIAGNTLNEAGGLDTQGKVISNHPVLTAPGSLFSILCVEDDTERERMFTLFWDRGTNRQNSFTKTILNMFTEQALWPEALSYGFMPNVQLILNLVDKVKPQLNAGTNNIELFESASLLENLRTPNRTFVRYGDSHRTIDGTDEISRYALNFAKRRGYTAIQTQAEIALKQSFPTTNGYNTSVPDTGFENYSALDLFWGEPLPNNAVVAFDYKPTVVINHAGIALQRNYVTNNNTEYGLVGIIGGAHYVHAHCAGISMELYGSGDVMAANGGLPPTLAERSTLPFQGYFNKYAGNNTVIVNGTSRGTTKAGAWGNDKFLYQDPVVNVAAEPKHLENPLSTNFSFATQFMDDNVNNCDQQRTLSTIRTSATTGYYFDLFRSKSLATNNFHDYIYHNLGDVTSLKNASDVALSVSPTTKYQVVVDDLQQSPGWLQFESSETTTGLTDAVKVRFDLTTTNKYMHMLMPSGITREYTKALGPATYEAKNGYVNKKTQIIAVRQTGEAWDRPFVSIFEPSSNAAATVQSVENITVNGKIVGAIVKSKLTDRETTDYIICNESNTGDISLPQFNLTFKGRFAVVRTEVKTDKKDITLYIGEGTQLNFENYALTGDSNKKGLLEVKDIALSTTLPTHTAGNTSSIIQFEDFNLGANQNATVNPGGVAPFGYSDTTAGNTAGNGTTFLNNDYRPGTDVDLAAPSAAPSAGEVAVNSGGNEFLYYTVQFTESGKYHFDVNYGHSNGSPRSVKFELVDTNFANAVTLASGTLVKTTSSTSFGTNPVTSNPNNVATTDNGPIIQFDIAAGTYVIKFTTVQSGPNYNWFKIIRDGDATSTTWQGTGWLNGTPNSSIDAIIDGDYTGASFTAKSLTVNATKSATITSGNLVITNEVINNGTLVIENGANLLQDAATVINANTGAITVKRNSNALLRLDYSLWSSPVAGQNLLAFSPATTTTRFYTYNPATGQYNAIADPSITPFTASKGYLIRMPNDADAVTPTAYSGVFTGVPHNGTVTVGLTPGYNLVGNPYPSNISFSSLRTDNSGLIGTTAYFWRKTNGAGGSAYCTFNASGSTYVSNNQPGAAVNFDGTIQSGQGFFVNATVSGNLSFTNTQRIGNTANQAFFRTKQTASADKVWLNATNAAGDFSQMAVTYSDGATSGVDNYDSKSINDSQYALTSSINEEEYTIQGRPAFDPTDEVALHFKTATAGDYTIALARTEGVFANGQEVYLVDNSTGVETNLKAGSYNFTATAGADSSRFSLKYQKTLKVDAPVFNENSLTVFSKNGTLYVNSRSSTIQNISVYDMQGRLVGQQNNVKATSATINNLKANQALIVQVTSENNTVVRKKVVN